MKLGAFFPSIGNLMHAGGEKNSTETMISIGVHPNPHSQLFKKKKLPEKDHLRQKLGELFQVLH